MAVPNGSFGLAVRKGAMKARRLRAPSAGLSGPQPRNCDLTQSQTADQQSPVTIDALVRQAGVAWPAVPIFSSPNALGAALLGGLQVKLLKNATAVLGDALAGGRGAPPSARLLARRGLRAAAVAACAASYAIKIWTLAGSLAHINQIDPSRSGLLTEAELANSVSALVLGPSVVGPASPPLLRAVAPVSALAADGLDIGAAVEGLVQVPLALPQQPLSLSLEELAAPGGLEDLAAGVGKVNDLVLACIGVVESCQELSKIAAASVANRAPRRGDKRGGSSDEGVSGSASCKDDGDGDGDGVGTRQ